jgi:hypothetical protein
MRLARHAEALRCVSRHRTSCSGESLLWHLLKCNVNTGQLPDAATTEHIKHHVHSASEIISAIVITKHDKRSGNSPVQVFLHRHETLPKVNPGCPLSKMRLARHAEALRCVSRHRTSCSGESLVWHLLKCNVRTGQLPDAATTEHIKHLVHSASEIIFAIVITKHVKRSGNSPVQVFLHRHETLPKVNPGYPQT